MLPHKNDREALRKQRLEVLKCPPETGSRFPPGYDGSSTVGARMARPLALDVQGSPPTAVGVGRGCGGNRGPVRAADSRPYMHPLPFPVVGAAISRPEPGSESRWGSMVPLRSAFGEGASDAAVRTGLSE